MANEKDSASRIMASGVSAATAKALTKELGGGSEPLKIGTTGTTAMAGNRKPTTTIRGGVLQQPAIADVDDYPTADDFNGLLAALRAAGVLAT